MNGQVALHYLVALDHLRLLNSTWMLNNDSPRTTHGSPGRVRNAWSYGSTHVSVGNQLSRF